MSSYVPERTASPVVDEVDGSSDDEPPSPTTIASAPTNPLRQHGAGKRLPGMRRRSSVNGAVTVRAFDLTEIKNVAYGDDCVASSGTKVVQKQERARRQSAVALSQPQQAANRGGGRAPTPPDGESQENTAARFDVLDVQTEQNALKYNMFKGGTREYYFPFLVAPDEVTVAPIYRWLLFVLPVTSNFLLGASLVTRDEFYGYLAYVIAPVSVICAAMHSMSRPRRRKLLLEEVSMLVIAVLLPLVLTTVEKCSGKEVNDGTAEWEMFADIVVGIIAFFVTAIGGPFIVESARTTMAFQSEEKLEKHLKTNVFVGGFSAMVSMTYLVMESGSCCISNYLPSHDTTFMLNQCWATMAPNYAFAMHLACSYCYSVYFLPFNEVTTRQIITLDISKIQKVELLLFLCNTALSLFLFGGKRPNATIPHFYSGFTFSIYSCWCIIFVLELTHVLQIRKGQRRRQLSLVVAQREVLDHVKSLQQSNSPSIVEDSVLQPSLLKTFQKSPTGDSAFRPLSLQVQTSRSRHNPSQGSNADFERWLANSKSVTSRDGSVPRDGRGSVPPAPTPTSQPTPDACGDYDGLSASPPQSLSVGLDLPPKKPTFSPPSPPDQDAREASETSSPLETGTDSKNFDPSPRQMQRAMSDSIAHELKAYSKNLENIKTSQRNQQKTEIQAAPFEPLPLKYARPIRGFLAFFPVAIALLSILAKSGVSGMSRRFVLSVWACWPFCAMCIGTLFISSFSKTKVGVWSETAFFIVGGPSVWIITDAFNFEWALENVRNRSLVWSAIVIVSGVLYSVIFLLRLRIRSVCDDETIYRILENSFNTFSYLTVPVVYLSLESVGWIFYLDIEDEGIFSSPRSVVKVNFLACMHLFGVLIFSLYFKHFTRYDPSEILRGKLSRRITSEVGLFIVATAICLFSLATKVTGRMNFGQAAPSVMASSQNGSNMDVLDNFHVALSFVFLACWWGIFVLEGIWHFNRLKLDRGNAQPMTIEAHSVIEMKPSRTNSMRRDELSVVSNGTSSHAESSRETIMSMSPQIMNPLWRYAVASVPVLFVPFTSFCWLFFSPSTAPFVYLFLSSIPINILSVFVVIFGQPSTSNSTWLELAAYLLGGPLSNFIGCVADFRWSYIPVIRGESGKANNRFGSPTFDNWGPLAFIIMRLIFTVALLFFTKLILRFRAIIAEQIRDVDRFVVYTVCGSAISAFAPAAYICLTSLGCVIGSYEDKNYHNIVVSPLCMQQLSCNIGVAIHICGVAILNIFLVKEFVDYGMDDVIAFSIPRHVKIDFFMLSIATFLSLTLYSWKFFVPNKDFETRMLILVGVLLAMDLILWGAVLIRQVRHVTVRAAAAKDEEMNGLKIAERKKSVFRSSSSNLSDKSEATVNIDFVVGNSQGISGFSPGLA